MRSSSSAPADLGSKARRGAEKVGYADPCQHRLPDGDAAADMLIIPEGNPKLTVGPLHPLIFRATES